MFLLETTRCLCCPEVTPGSLSSQSFNTASSKMLLWGLSPPFSNLIRPPMAFKRRGGFPHTIRRRWTPLPQNLSPSATRSHLQLAIEVRSLKNGNLIAAPLQHSSEYDVFLSHAFWTAVLLGDAHSEAALHKSVSSQSAVDLKGIAPASLPCACVVVLS